MLVGVMVEKMNNNVNVNNNTVVEDYVSFAGKITKFVSKQKGLCPHCWDNLKNYLLQEGGKN